MAHSLADSGWGPDVAVHGVAADAQDAFAEKLEEADEIAVRCGEQVGLLVEGAFLIGEPGERGADGAGGS